jgi:hypothetical protein
MRYILIPINIFCILILLFFGNAEATCLDKVAVLELKRDHAVSNGGIWGYFERNFTLDKIPAETLQLDSRINKIFFLLNHLCETQSGVPLTPLAIYVSKNISQKGEDKFKDELLVLGKTPQRIKEWFDFCKYALNHASRQLLHSEIQKAIDQSSPLVIRYVKLTEIKTSGNSPEKYFQKIKILMEQADQLLTSQPYLRKALEETSHYLYWDISEGDLG